MSKARTLLAQARHMVSDAEDLAVVVVLIPMMAMPVIGK